MAVYPGLHLGIPIHEAVCFLSDGGVEGAGLTRMSQGNHQRPLPDGRGSVTECPYRAPIWLRQATRPPFR
jgi:hypothetical protein